MYIPTIGLEIHVQLRTKSKMFCSCANNSETGSPNKHTCPVCMGHPGTFPVINKEAVMKVLRVGKTLNCNLSDTSYFDRKNYFYPDLPKGYQISQDKYPLCKGGYLQINDKKIRITRIHLEEDTGRLVHDNKTKSSLVDFNRSSVPLMELVTEADITSAKEARNFAKELRLILRYLDVSDANMNEGQMRVEVNISLSKKGEKRGTKVEIKNLNSFRVVYNAIEYEIKRQEKILNERGSIVQETRGWSDEKEKTFSQRTKEDAHDYRYFPEPDLPPLDLRKEPFNKENIKIDIELPSQKRNRFRQEFKLENNSEIESFIENKDLANYFEEVVKIATKNVKNKTEIARITKNYLLSDLLGILNGKSISLSPVSSSNFAEFIILIYNKEISSKVAKSVLKQMAENGEGATIIVEKKGLIQINNKEEIKKIVMEVIAENSSAVKDYKEGKKEALQFLIGQVMAKTKGQASPEEVNKMFAENL